MQRFSPLASSPMDLLSFGNWRNVFMSLLSNFYPLEHQLLILDGEISWKWRHKDPWFCIFFFFLASLFQGGIWLKIMPSICRKWKFLFEYKRKELGRDNWSLWLASTGGDLCRIILCFGLFITWGDLDWGFLHYFCLLFCPAGGIKWFLVQVQ